MKFKRIVLRILISLSVLLVAVSITKAFTVFAQEAIGTSVSVTPTLSSQTTTDQIQILNAQLELMWRYDQRLLETVYWTLGVAVALTVGITGYGYWFNSRISEREKQALEESLLAFIRQESDRIQSDLRSEVNSQYEKIRRQSEEQINERVLQLQDELGVLTRRVAVLRWEQQKSIAEMNESFDNYSIAFSRYLEMLDIALSMDLHHLLPESLHGLKKNVGKLQSPLDPFVSMQLAKHKLKIPTQHMQDLETIEGFMRNIV